MGQKLERRIVLIALVFGTIGCLCMLCFHPRNYTLTLLIGAVIGLIGIHNGTKNQ
jgi:hypothetical protein